MCAMHINNKFENKFTFVVLKQIAFPSDMMSGVFVVQ